MPPGQLDQISEAIGEIRGTVAGIERYMHEREHGLNNLSQKLDAHGNRITREIGAVEERMRVRFEQVEIRIALLETAKAKQDGAKGTLLWLVQNPLIGWIFIAIGMFWAWLSSHGKAP